MKIWPRHSLPSYWHRHRETNCANIQLPHSISKIALCLIFASNWFVQGKDQVMCSILFRGVKNLTQTCHPFTPTKMTLYTRSFTFANVIWILFKLQMYLMRFSCKTSQRSANPSPQSGEADRGGPVTGPSSCWGFVLWNASARIDLPSAVNTQ